MVSPARPRRRRRPAWAAPLVAVLALGAIWSLGWLAAQRAAGIALDGWIEAEASRGRQWTCPGRTVDGYPFALAVRCTQPTFAGEMAGHQATGHVETLRASLALGHPRTVEVGLAGPLYLRGLDDSFDLVASWERLQVAVTGLTGRPDGAALQAGRLAVTLATPNRANVNLRAASLDGAATPADGSPRDTAFRFAATGVVLPTLEGWPDLSAPADATGEGVLGEAALLDAPTVRRLEAWRAAGGELRLASLMLRQGAFTGMARGVLALDEAHRPAGRLDTTVTGFEPIAKRLGIPLAGVQIGGLLTSLLTGGKPPADPKAIALPLTLADGRLSVGPINTGVRLDPLY